MAFRDLLKALGLNKNVFGQLDKNLVLQELLRARINMTKDIEKMIYGSFSTDLNDLAAPALSGLSDLLEPTQTPPPGASRNRK